MFKQMPTDMNPFWYTFYSILSYLNNPKMHMKIQIILNHWQDFTYSFFLVFHVSSHYCII